MLYGNLKMWDSLQNMMQTAEVVDRVTTVTPGGNLFTLLVFFAVNMCCSLFVFCVLCAATIKITNYYINYYFIR